MVVQNKALITFSKKYEREWNHLQNQGNKSKYIAQLIAKDLDLNGGLNLESNELEKIKEALRDVLAEYQFGIVANRKDDEDLDYSDKIDDLFNI